MFVEDYHGLGGGNFLLSIIYFGCAVGAFRQCACRPKNASAWKSIRRYFMLSLLFGCVVRSAAFATVFIVTLTTPDAIASGGACVPLTPSATDQQKAIRLFDKVLFVLTNLPDMMIMSSFALFFLVWLEVFQTARIHWHSGGRLRRRWMRNYMILNIMLYTLQVIIYALLFFDQSGGCDSEETYHTIINYTIASFDVALPVLFVLVWIVFMLTYAGFPYRSNQARYASNRLTSVTSLWCLGRCVLGVLSFGSIGSDWFGDMSAEDHSMIVLSVLVTCDILPICLSLTGSVGILLDDAIGLEAVGRGAGGDGRKAKTLSASGPAGNEYSRIGYA
eukprot:g3426.t1